MAANSSALPVEWMGMHNLQKQNDHSYKVLGLDAWLKIKPHKAGVDYSYLRLDLSSSHRTDLKISWFRPLPVNVKNFPLHLEPGEGNVTRVVDMGVIGELESNDIIELKINAPSGAIVNIASAEFITFAQVPRNLLPELVDFRIVTSKLHYLQNERIEYKAQMLARNWPDRESAKVLNVELLDADGKCHATAVQHYGIQPLHHIKELYGVLDVSEPLKPGKYYVEATVRDLRDDFVLSSRHNFGVQGEDDPFVCESPYRFLKDFSIIKGHDGLWHVFSITGDFVGTHEWFEDGQERTFSHGTSPDLRHWTWHEPVLSISNDTYPDSDVKFKDRNIWAPHVIRNKDTYYMFYTSVNAPGVQSISLATSKDLFNWTDHDSNPIVTFEGVDWALWHRERGGAGRDPMVLADEDKFYMYVTADANEGEDRGVVAVLESDDLIDWRNPQIAVRGRIACESPHVWKSGDTYYMVTSSYGSGTWTSKHPVTGWQHDVFPRTPVQEVERYVKTSGGYAEEVVPLSDGNFLMAAITWRTWGNSIYIFKMITNDQGRPVHFEQPINLSAQ